MVKVEENKGCAFSEKERTAFLSMIKYLKGYAEWEAKEKELPYTGYEIIERDCGGNFFIGIVTYTAWHHNKHRFILCGYGGHFDKKARNRFKAPSTDKHSVYAQIWQDICAFYHDIESGTVRILDEEGNYVQLGKLAKKNNAAVAATEKPLIEEVEGLQQLAMFAKEKAPKVYANKYGYKGTDKIDRQRVERKITALLKKIKALPEEEQMAVVSAVSKIRQTKASTPPHSNNRK